jgi:hypothetical protein
LSRESEAHTGRLVRERRGIDILALRPLATVADHVEEGTQRTWREAKIRR